MHFGARLAAMGRTESPAGTLRGLVKAGQLHIRPVAGSTPRWPPHIPQPSPARNNRDAWGRCRLNEP